MSPYFRLSMLLFLFYFQSYRIRCTQVLHVRFQVDSTNDTLNNKFVACNESELNAPRPVGQRPCIRDLTFLEDCGQFPVGYNGSNPEPCLIIKVNKIFGFTPKPLTIVDAKSLNDTMLPPAVSPYILNELLSPHLFKKILYSPQLQIKYTYLKLFQRRLLSNEDYLLYLSQHYFWR